MKKKEKNDILAECALMSDDELEEAYYDAVFNALGSLADMMEERFYDDVDILERRKYEKYLGELPDVIGSVCESRGIELWRHVNIEEE